MECKFKNNRICSLTSCTNTHCLIEQEGMEDKCKIFNMYKELLSIKNVLNNAVSELETAQIDKAEIINLFFQTNAIIFITNERGKWYVNIDIGQGRVEQWEIRDKEVRNGMYDSIPHR